MKTLEFNNIQTYKFTRDFDLSETLGAGNFDRSNKLECENALQKVLSEFAFTPCLPTEHTKAGWTPLFSDIESPKHAVFFGRHIVMFYKKEKREIPKTEVNKRLLEQIEKYEDEKGIPVTKKIKEAMIEAIYLELLPHAFSKFTLTPIWIDLDKQRLIAVAGSSSSAEEAISLLRKTLGSLPVIPIASELRHTADIRGSLTNWIMEESTPKGFQLGYEVKLESPESQGGSILFKDRTLNAPDIKEAATFYPVKKVELLYGTYEDIEGENQFYQSASFSISDDFVIKKIKYADFVFSEDVHTDDIKNNAIATLTIVTAQLQLLIDSLITAFVGPNNEK